MARHEFTAADLAPLRPLLASPLAQMYLTAAVPIKSFAPPGQHVEEVDLPVDVRGRDTPDGVPLEEILAAAREVTPTLEGLVLRGDRLLAVHRSRPEPRDQERFHELMADQGRLLTLRRSRSRSAPTDGGPADVGDDVRRALLDEETPDAEWLRGFRQWAVRHLIDPDERR